MVLSENVEIRNHQCRHNKPAHFKAQVVDRWNLRGRNLKNDGEAAHENVGKHG